MTMKAEPRSKRKSVDDGILSSFDPLVEGASFQIIEEGLDPQSFARSDESTDELNAPEVLATFDLAESLANVPQKLFFRIGEVADLLDLKTYVLRFWETEFPMVSPSKSRSGQRVYRRKDVEMLLLIKHLLYVERFSIEGARKRIRELKQKPSDRASSKSAAALNPKSAGIFKASDRDSLREALADLQKSCQPELTQFFRF